MFLGSSMKRPLFWGVAGLLIILLLALLQRPLAARRGRMILDTAQQLHRADRSAEAQERFREALRLADEQGDRRMRARVLVGSATALYESTTDFDRAFERLQESLSIARDLGDQSLEADALSALGVYFWFYRRQRHRVLDEFYRPAFELYRQLDDAGGMASLHSSIALTYLSQADYETAADHLEQSRRLFEGLDGVVGLSDVHRYLGLLYGQLERYDLASEHYAKSLELCEQADYQLGCRLVEGQSAQIYLRLGDFERVVEILDRRIALEIGSPYTRRNHLVTRGHALLHAGRPQEAGVSYQWALDLDGERPALDAPFRAMALTMLAHARMQAADLEAAEDALSRAEAIPIAVKGWATTVLHTLARADLAAYEGRQDASLQHLLTASEIENQTFGLAQTLFFQTQYRQVFERLFGLLFEDVVTQDRAEELAFRFVEQMRYRSFRSLIVRLGSSGTDERAVTPIEEEAMARIDEISRLYSAAPTAALWQDLRQAYGTYEDVVLRAELTSQRYQMLAGQRPIEEARLRQLLAPDEALVEFVVAGERVFALVLTRHRLVSVLMPTTAAQLEAKVKLFRRHLFDEDEVATEAWRPLAAELGRLLASPLEAAGGLDQATRLVLVPMGFLHDVPFAALQDDQGRLWVEKYTLSRAPSATLWAQGRTSGPGARHDYEMAAFGLRQPGRSKLEALGFAEREATAVATIFDGQARLGELASEAEFKRLAPLAQRLHVATHGLIEPQLPLYSRLLLEPGESEDGELTVREILDLSLSAELVTLSACGTGQSPATSGIAELEVDRLGFVEAFLHAGADNVLATLLPVSDAATAAFTVDFHRRLKSVSPAQALAMTRRQMLIEGVLPEAEIATSDLRHPRYWAPFVLVSGH